MSLGVGVVGTRMRWWVLLVLVGRRKVVLGMRMEDGGRGGSWRGSVAGRGESGRGTTVVDMMMVSSDYIGGGGRRNARPVHVRVGDGGRLSLGSCAGRRWEGDEPGSGKAEEEDKGRAPNLDTSTRICTTSHQSHNNSTAVKCAPPQKGTPITPIISSPFSRAAPISITPRVLPILPDHPPAPRCRPPPRCGRRTEGRPRPPPLPASSPSSPFHSTGSRRTAREHLRDQPNMLPDPGASSAEWHQPSAHQFPRCARSKTPRSRQGRIDKV